MQWLDSPTFAALGNLALSLGLGIIVGLERERRGSLMAGIRTFPLVSLFGTLLGLLAERHGSWIVAAGLLVVGALTTASVLGGAQRREPDRGLTTEAAFLLMFGVGAYIPQGDPVVAVALTVAATLLLQLRLEMHRFAGRVSQTDMSALVQFVVAAFVLLPIVPNVDIGPFAAFNPYEIWRMVVLIVGMNLFGYLVYKLAGREHGVLVSALAGGLVSSTAVTVSAARRSRSLPGLSTQLAAAIVLTCGIVYIRVLVEMAATAPALAVAAIPGLAVLFVVALVGGGWIWWRRDRAGASDSKADDAAQKNPTELKAAIIFGITYAIVKLVVAWAHSFAGEAGLYVVAVISGLTDVDAITLSTAQLVAQNKLPAREGLVTVFLAVLANLAFKGGVAAVLGTRQVGRIVALAFGASLVAGAVVIALL